MPFELRQLRHLLAVAEHGSFGRAAAALGMTQPALSRSVKLLERAVGSALFERSTQGVTPTDDGRLLIGRARELVRAADEVDRAFVRRSGPGAGLVVVGAGPYPAETIVPAAVARFAAAHPQVRVRVVQREWDDLLRMLRAREVDFFVGEFSTFEGEPDVDIEPLAPHQVYFVARRGHPLRRKAAVAAEHTFDYPFVALSRHPPRVLEPMLAARRRQDAARHARPFPAIESGSLSSVKRIVADSDAIAALPLPPVAEDVERGRLVVLGTEPWMSLRYAIVGPKGRDPSAASGRLADFVREAEAKLTRDEGRLAARLVPGLARRAPAARTAVEANE
jgi:DNA-binding transcriptional LysR family regulator